MPVINLEDGSRLSGDDAPLKKNLEHWLDQHPGYMVDSREELEEGEIVSGLELACIHITTYRHVNNIKLFFKLTIARYLMVMMHF